MDGHLLRYNHGVKYALIDLETFNLCLSFRHNRPWQAGILEVHGEKVVNAQDIRIKWPDAPHLQIGQEAAMVTRFNQAEHDKLAILPNKAFEQFWPILENADYIIMHNGLKFDLYILRDYAKFMGKPWKWIVNKIIDTRAVAQGIKLKIPFQSKTESFIEYQYRMTNTAAKGIKTSLKVLGEEYEIEHDYVNLHDAIVDLTLNLKVWNKLKFQIEI